MGGGLVGPITALSAVPLQKDRWSLAVQFEYQALDEISDRRLAALSEAHEDAHSVESLSTVSLNGNYGLSDDFTLGATLPYVKRSGIREPEHIHGAEDEIAELGDSEGLGDLRLFSHYRFLRNEDERADTALILGIKMPTGKDDERAESGGEREHGHEEDELLAHGHGSRFEAEHQPGSGSWDPFFGIAHSRRWNGLAVHASLLYTLVTEGVQDTNLGDSVQYNLALGYRLNGGGHGHLQAESETPHFHHYAAVWELMLELGGEWREKLEIDGENERNSGGSLIFLSPGARVLFGGHGAASLSVGLPVFEELNGTQSEPELRVIGSLALGF